MVDRTIAVKLRAEVADFKRDMAGAAKAVDNNVSSVETLSSHVALLGTALTGFAALSVTRFAQFDKAMSSAQAATRATGAELDSLRQAAIRAGADTQFSAAEAASGIEELAKAGVVTTDILNGGLNGALSLAAAGELEVADAAEIAATAITQFKLEGADVGHVADVLAAGAGKAQGGVQDMALALKYAGVPLAQLGVSFEETSGAVALFAKNGILGEQAGTSLRSIISSLTSPSAAAAKEMKALGINVFDANDEFIGLEGVAGQLESRLGVLSEKERAAALGRIFGNESLQAANVLYDQGAEGIAHWTDAVNDQGYAAEQAAIQNDNLLGDLERLGGSFDSVLIQSGSGANDSLRTLVQTAESLVDAIGEIPGPVLTATTLIAGAGGLALLGAAGMGKLVVGTRDAIGAYRDMVPAGSRAERAVRGVGRGAIVSAGALGVLLVAAQAIESTAPDVSLGVEEMRSRLRALADDGSGAVRLFEDLNSTWVNSSSLFSDSKVVEDAESFQALLRQTADPSFIGKAQDQLASFLGLFGSSDLGQFQGRLAEVNTELATMASGGDLTGATDAFSGLADAYKLTDEQAGQLLTGLPEFRDALIGQAEAAGLATDDATLLKLALGEVKPAAEGAADAVAGVAPEMDAEAIAAERAAQATESYAKALAATADPVSTYESILARKEEAERETAEATAAATDDASDSWEDYADDVSVTTADLIKDWQRQAREAAAFEENLAVIAAAGGQAMADELRAKGPEVAGSVAAVIAEAGPKQQASAIASHAAATGGSISQQMADTLVAQGWRLQRAVDGTIEAAHPKKDITVTVTDAGSADRVKGEIASIPTSKTVTITTIRQVLGGGGGSQYVLRNSAMGSRLPGFPTGGRLPGRPPSNPLEDNLLGVDGAGIPRVRVRSREWVVREPAADYYGDGLMSAINAKAIPREVLAGLTGLASGGGVLAARTDVLRTQRALEAARRSHRRVHTDSSKDRWRSAQEAAEAARDRYERLREEASSLRTDLRRGNIRDQVTGGLSGARGATDQMRDLADSGDLSRRGSRRLAGSADKAESALTALYRQADRLDKKVANATENFEKWKGIADGVSSSISGGFSLGGVTGGTDPWSGAERAATGSQLLSAAKAYEAKAKTLVLRLQALRKAGYGTAILQEVAAQGVEGGTAMADALLTLSPADMKALQSSMSEIDRYGDRAGAEAAGGNLSSSARALELAEAQAAAIDKRIGKWAEWIGSVLAKSLGIKARANGGPVTAGHPYLVNEDTPNSELFIPSQSGYVLNNRQMGSLSAGGPSVTHNWNITQYNPVAEAPSVTAAKTARQLANVGRR